MPTLKRPILTLKNRGQAAFTPAVQHRSSPNVTYRPVSVVAPAQPEMAQAQRDVEKGLIDTDCYTRLGKLIPRGKRS